MTGRAVTDEAAWRPWLAAPAVRPFPDEHHERAVVVAAHPDDETLGVGGLLQRLHERGTAVELVVATDGDAAFPALSPGERAELGRTRRRELRDSLRAQGLHDVPVRWLGLPDGRLADHRADLVAALTESLRDADVCLAPWPADPHPDHRAAGAATCAAAPLTAHRWSYPIWMWHWLRPDDPAIPSDRVFAHRLTAAQRRRKAAGIAAFESQLKPGPYGAEPILDAGVLTHFERDVEIVFRQPPTGTAPVTRFTELYEDRPDPWRTETAWYERRKRALALAALPDERYAFAVEPACGVGTFTRALADRCDRLLAFDPVPAAVARARAATAGLSHVEVRRQALPAGLDGRADLVVFSEIRYYLSDHDLAETVRRATRMVRPGGHVLAVHWRPWAAEAPRDGVAAHRALTDHPDLAVVVSHFDADFVPHVLARR